MHNHFLDASSRMVRQQLRDRVHLWVRAQQEAGVLKPYPPEQLRALVIGGFSRLVRESLDDNMRITRKLADEFESLAWEAIARPEHVQAS